MKIETLKSRKNKELYNQLVLTIAAWTDNLNDLQIKLQKKQIPEILLILKTFHDLTEQYLEQVLSFPSKEQIEDIQCVMLSRIILLYRDLTAPCLASSELQNFSVIIREFIVQLYNTLQRNLQKTYPINLFTIFVTIFEIGKEVNEEKVKQLCDILNIVVLPENLQLFKKERSCAIMPDLLMATGSLLLRSPILTTNDLDRCRSFNLGHFFDALSKCISITLNVCSVGTRQISIVAKGIFDYINIILSSLPDQSITDCTEEMTSFICRSNVNLQIVNGIMVIIKLNYSSFGEHEGSYLTAIFQRLGHIFSCYFSRGYIQLDQICSTNNGIATISKFYQMFLHEFSTFLCLIQNSVSSDLMDSLTSLTVLFTTKSLGNFSSFNISPAILELHLKMLLSVLHFYSDLLPTEFAINEKEGNKSLQGSQDQQNPILEKFQKLITYSVAIIIQIQITDSNDFSFTDFENGLLSLFRSRPIFHRAISAYVLREKNQKILYYCKDKKLSHLRSWKKLYNLVCTIGSSTIPAVFPRTWERVLEVEFELTVKSVTEYYAIMSNEVVNSSIEAEFSGLKKQYDDDLAQVLASLTPAEQAYCRWFKIKIHLLYHQIKHSSLSHEVNEMNSFPCSRASNLGIKNTFSEALSRQETQEIIGLYSEWKEIFTIIFSSNSNQKNKFHGSGSSLIGDEALINHLLVVILNSSELLNYLQILNLMGNHQLQYLLYQDLFQQPKLFEFNSFYNADIIYLIRVHLCIDYYWNNYPSKYFSNEQQLFNTKSNNNLLENEQLLSTKKTALDNNRRNELMPNDSLPTQSKFSYNCNIFLSLEDYFLSCHKLLTSPIPSSSVYGTSDVEEKGTSDQFLLQRISLQSHCDYLITEIRQFKSLESVSSASNHGNSLFFSTATLLKSRFQSFAYGDVVEALANCRHALHYCTCCNNSKSTNQILLLFWVSVRFEIVILISEIYDFLGKATRCMDYLAEGLSMARLYPSLNSLFQLHSFRLFVRLDTTRLDLVLEQFLNTMGTSSIPNSSNKEFFASASTVDSIAEKNHHYLLTENLLVNLLTIFPSIRQKIKEQIHLRLLLLSAEVGDTDGTSEFVTLRSIFQKFTDYANSLAPCLTYCTGKLNLSYRFSHRLWGFDEETFSSDITSWEKVEERIELFQFVINMGSKEENDIVHNYLKPRTKCKSVNVQNTKPLLPAKLLWQGKYNLQIGKQIRKCLCYEYYLLSEIKSEEMHRSCFYAFNAFLAGCSSISMGKELSNLSLSEFKRSNMNSTASNSCHVNNPELYSKYGKWIQQAIEYQDLEVQQLIQQKLLSFNNFIQSQIQKKNCKILFLSIDSVNERILIGSWTTSNTSFGLSSVIAAKYQTEVLQSDEYEKFMLLIKNWKEILQQNNKSLHSFDPEKVHLITSNEKQQWWNTREAINKKMKEILDEMQSLLQSVLSKLLNIETDSKSKNPSDCSLHPAKFMKRNQSYENLENIPTSENVHSFNADEDLIVKDSSENIEALFQSKLLLSSVTDDDETVSVSSEKNKEKYEALKIPELKQKLKERSLPVNGKKSDLIDRLRRNDLQRTLYSSSTARTNSTVNARSNSSKNLLSLNSSRNGSSNSVQGRKYQSNMKPKSSASEQKLQKMASSSSSLTSLQTKSTSKSFSTASLSSLSFLSDEEAEKMEHEVNQTDSEHIFLMLDEAIQEFPFESLPDLKFTSSSRILSLNHLFSLLDETVASDFTVSTVDPKSCWFVIDPERDLPGTQETMKEFIDNHDLKQFWVSYVGETPMANDIREQHAQKDIFVYCGHGSGEKYYSKIDTDFAEMRNIAGKSSFPACFLFGCSSVRFRTRGFHEANGALNRLADMKSPFIVGNLWDVTDKDLDRFCCETLGNYLQSTKPQELGQTVAKARNICKLPFAVGSAAVVYGIPLPSQ